MEHKVARSLKLLELYVRKTEIASFSNTPRCPGKSQTFPLGKVVVRVEPFRSRNRPKIRAKGIDHPASNHSRKRLGRADADDKHLAKYSATVLKLDQENALQFSFCA